MKTGIIFDLDGTLWDACAAIADSWNEYLKRQAPEYEIHLTREDLRSVCGLTMKAIGDRLLSKIPEEKRDKLIAGCCAFEVEYLKDPRVPVQVYPGVPAIMHTLREQGYHVYMVSNCQSGYIEDFFARTGADRYVEDYEYYGRNGLNKDENIRLLYQRNHLGTGAYVGDTQGDYDSTVSAGCSLYFIHAAYGFGRVEPEVPRILDIRELPDRLKKEFGLDVDC